MTTPANEIIQPTGLYRWLLPSNGGEQRALEAIIAEHGSTEGLRLWRLGMAGEYVAPGDEYVDPDIVGRDPDDLD